MKHTCPAGKGTLSSLDGVRGAVDEILYAFLQQKATEAGGVLPREVTDLLGGFLRAGGKRLRPLICVMGWRAASDTVRPIPASVVNVAAALEMFHAFALIHDDIMDDSATRRGHPTLHRELALRHRQGRERRHPVAAEQAARRAGESCAILIGDIALCWSDELLHTAGLSPDQLARTLGLVDLMRTELVYGQYLDVTRSQQPNTAITLVGTLQTIRYKTAKYTIERPLHIGASLAGADKALMQAMSAFALPLGEAFQLRDDLLGAFGSPAHTGKPNLDDLREGKHTALIALALQSARPAEKQILNALYGNPCLEEEGAAQVRTAIRSAGADRQTEEMIQHLYDRAQAALEALPVPEVVRHQLRDLAERCVWRTE
ncbi:polyprenyl synthetase family protein [Streptomyces sp. NRRL F-2664]|uniref:polyprenyl synthetase family protein n=1 Tax=Streptomyces sp. NRRL F-2664 TaxID=1463842 RepID=UPI0004CB56C2|nr:polyprenyl synthetase family protein [Streptomyces sp. NRRL F-2664]